jgi:hypothetical protein
MTTQPPKIASEGIMEVEELLKWLEFGSWTTLALTPFLRFVNGPAVSRAQLIVQTGLVSIATIAAVFLLVRRLCRQRQIKTDSRTLKSEVCVAHDHRLPSEAKS